MYVYTRHSARHRRRAATVVMVGVTVPVLLGFAALAVDVGYLHNVRADLQHAADAAAHAGALRLPAPGAARSIAIQVATTNYPNHGTVVGTSDVVLGNWDPGGSVFTAGGNPVNAVRVVAQRSEQNGNPVEFFFAGIFGKYQTDVSATATAYSSTLAPNFSVRFLIDNEMFDTDVPAIEDFATGLGVTSDDLLTDADGDDFIDFPPTVIELPTGQVGDEGLFEIGPAFPYTDTSSPSLEDFLLFEEGGDQHGILTSDLDPLIGVEPLSDPNRYADFVDPNRVQVSTVYKNDISDTNPGVNALGERRGLVAFKIIGVGADPDGAGSVLPNLIIEIVDPTILDMSGGGMLFDDDDNSVQIVQ